MRISDWSSDVCSSDLRMETLQAQRKFGAPAMPPIARHLHPATPVGIQKAGVFGRVEHQNVFVEIIDRPQIGERFGLLGRSEEHTSELQSLMRISYAVFCLKTKKKTYNNTIPL